MNKIPSLLILSSVLLAVSCGRTGNVSFPVSLTDEMDSLSYYVGLDLGDYLVRTNQKLDIRDELVLEKVIAGMKESLEREAGSRSDAHYEWLRKYFSETLPQKNLHASERFLRRALDAKKDAVRTPSGLVYEILLPGTGPHPDAADLVLIRYEGRRMDGSLDETTYDMEDPEERPMDTMPKGLQEGLGQIGEGGIIKLWIPPSLAFGKDGNEYIGPNQALYYYVELVQCNRYE